MNALPKAVLTPTAVLASERAAETKSELFAGEMFAMAGTTMPPRFLLIPFSHYGKFPPWKL